MQLFRTLLYLFYFTSFLIVANQITIKNYDLGFNKSYYGNVSILCKNQGACNMTKIYCDTGDCYIEADGHNKGQLNNLIIDARNIQKGYKFEIKCGIISQSSNTNTNCKNVKVLCPLQRGASCMCSNCNYFQVELYCELGIGVYCTGGRVVSSWHQNNIWCDGGPISNYYGGYGGGNGKFICENVDWEIFSCEGIYTNPISAHLYSFAPNEKCIAFKTNYYHTYYKAYIRYITTYSCRETINSTSKEYKYHLPICVKYISKPDDIPELKQYFNITRIIIKNKTNIINKTNWIDKERINRVNIKRIENKENSTKFELDLNNIFVLGGLSLGGIIILTCTFYVTWKCWLQEKVEEMIMASLIGEEGVSCLERVGCFNEYFQTLREIKVKSNDMVEYYGLTPEEIAICKQAKAISKIKYQEAINMRFEELAKHAVRPRDFYHKELFKNVIKEPNKKIEMSRQDIPVKEEEPPILEKEKTVINILPGTPRRRLPRRSMEI